MRFYQHRINRLEELEALPPHRGLEFDLRENGRDVVITHDAFSEGPTLDAFLAKVGQRPCIFNVKCDGIEDYVMRAAARHGVEDYFFVDLPLPGAVRLAKRGETRQAVRYSEYEPAELARVWRGRARWLWIDGFTAWPMDPVVWRELAQSFSICLVSPELHGHGLDAIGPWRASLGELPFHGVCSKSPERWGAP